MIIKFDEMEDRELQAFYGGDGALIAKMFVDEKNKILKGKLAPGASIGAHQHMPTSETIFIISGKAEGICDGVVENLTAGDCHYCPQGSTHALRNVGDEDLYFYAVVPMHASAQS